MNKVKYAYAKNEKNVYVFINDIHQNNRYKYYYLLSDKNEKIQMIPVINGKRQKHFRTKSDGVAVGMSAEHLNLIAKLCHDKQFYCKDLDLPISAKRAEDEYLLKDINRIVDVAYFDDNDDFLCGIEVVHTNDINYSKFKDIYQSDYLIFKVYTYASEKFKFVNNRKIETETNQQVIRGFEEEIEKSNTDGIGEDEKLLYILKEYSRKLFNEIYPMQSKHNIGFSFNDLQREFKVRLQETEGEEGQLIRECNELTKEINEFLLK